MMKIITVKYKFVFYLKTKGEVFEAIVDDWKKVIAETIK